MKKLLIALLTLNTGFALEIISHRGHGYKKIIEKPQKLYRINNNTIPAIEKAFELGATIVEIDLQMTKDGQIVLFHDTKLDFNTNLKGRIKDYTYDSLGNLNRYRYYKEFTDAEISHPPTLFKDVLEIWENKTFLLNPKNYSKKFSSKLFQILKKQSHQNFYIWGHDHFIRDYLYYGFSKDKVLPNHHQSYKCWEDFYQFPEQVLLFQLPQSCYLFKNLIRLTGPKEYFWIYHFSKTFKLNGFNLWVFFINDSLNFNIIKDYAVFGFMSSKLHLLPLKVQQ
ncbi:MAG: hypothetical protein CME62_12015 [Halobacteriovoraceae bacterium]|nr:hypothetical protein [Halobacteriovoraceae bacterium]|tara:strand:+ start:34965 stop:35807 length:843 start_codon:yes stop_codon:yes gene_type:complete